MKIKKIIMALLSTIISVTMLATNVFAINAGEMQNNIAEMHKFSVSADSGISTYSADSGILYLGDVSWSDSKTVKWKEENTTAYHTVTSRLGDLYVYDSYVVASKYTNYKGTYNNVWVVEVAPNTLFMSADIYNSPSTGYLRDYTDPFLGLDTPRRLTEEELTLENSVAYVILEPDTLEVIDFYSVFNPLIIYGWNDPKFTF